MRGKCPKLSFWILKHRPVICWLQPACCKIQKHSGLNKSDMTKFHKKERNVPYHKANPSILSQITCFYIYLEEEKQVYKIGKRGNSLKMHLKTLPRGVRGFGHWHLRSITASTRIAQNQHFSPSSPGSMTIVPKEERDKKVKTGWMLHWEWVCMWSH